MARAIREAADICHLSVLNPVRHPRMYYRQARTQAQAGWRVAVVGVAQPAIDSAMENLATVQEIALPPLQRVSLARCWRPWRAVGQAWRLRPRVVHLHAPELLLPALLLRLRGIRLVYDVHEDYAANLRAGVGIPRWLGRIMAVVVRGLERLSVRTWVAAVTYAETSYTNHLRAPQGKYLYLRNLYAAPERPPEQMPPLPTDMPVMLLSGTLDERWGVAGTIRLWHALNRHRPVCLVLAGYAADTRWLHDPQLSALLREFPDRFRLVGVTQPVPYAVIDALIARCTFGTAFYDAAPHLAGKIPTKVYEFMAHGKPLLIGQHAAIQALNQQLHFAVPVPENDLQATTRQVLAELEANFPTVRRNLSAEVWSWAGDAHLLLDLSRRLTS